MNKESILKLIKWFKDNNPINIFEWMAICSAHILLYPEKYNPNGSVKSTIEKEGKADETMYGKKGVIH